MEDKDYMIRAISGNEEVRAFALRTTKLVEKARQIHDDSPVATAALGRTLSAALMMGDMLKNKQDLITIHIQGEGPLKQILATANMDGEVKGYVADPSVILPPKENGHLDVGGAIGKGVLTVIKDYGLKDPYVSQVDLVTGEIAEDLTYYFAQSEQTPTAIGLGVLMNKDVTVRCAGGFIVQLMPNAHEKTIAQLEKNLKGLSSVTDILKDGHTPEDLLAVVLRDMDMKILGQKEVRFACHCSKEKGYRALATIGKKELQELLDEGKGAEVNCEFCGKNYCYSTDDIKNILIELSKKA